MAGVTSSARVGYCYDPRMREHRHLSYDHPEQPARISSIFETLETSGCTSRMIVLPAREVSEDEVTLVHSRNVWNRVDEIESMTMAQIQNKSRSYTAKSLFINHKTPSSVRLSCGATIEAAMAVAEGRCKRSVAIVRPPGHHAEPNKSMGFCFFNNVAVAAKAILQKTGIRKILILDWDVHHGNGVQATFEEDPNVLYVSIHRYENASFYPHDTSGSYSSKGKGRGLGFSVNIPWSKGGKGDRDYLYAFEKVVMPIAKEFAPEIVLVSAGFDAAEGDPLGECNVTPHGFARMTGELCSLAGGRIVIVLEGGYNLASTSDSMLAVTKVLLDDPVPFLADTDAPDRSTAKTISDVRRVHTPHWKCFQPDGTSVVSSTSSHRASTTIAPRKRKRKDSDTEYTPHQKPGNSQSPTPTVRRSSKRLAVSAKLEQQPIATTTRRLSIWSVSAKRQFPSTASTSASSDSSSSLSTSERNTPDAPDLAPKSKPERGPRPLPFSEYRSGPVTPMKFGFPPRKKRVVGDHSRLSPISTGPKIPHEAEVTSSARLSPISTRPQIPYEAGRAKAPLTSMPIGPKIPRLSETIFIPRSRSQPKSQQQQQQQHPPLPRQTHTVKPTPVSHSPPQPAPTERECCLQKETVRVLHHILGNLGG